MEKNMNQQTEKNKKRKRIALIIALAAAICIVLFIVMFSCQPQQKNEVEALESGAISQEPSSEGLESGAISPDVQPSDLPKGTENAPTSESARPSSGAVPETPPTPQPKATKKPSAASKPETTATPKPAPTPQPTKSGHYEKVWVVDKAAESYEEDVYEEVDKIICLDCGAEITNNKTEHLRDHVLNGGNGQWKVDTERKKVGTNKIEIPEQGHWEEVWVEN